VNIVWWILLGLVAGALARWLMPGRIKGGWVVTIVLGILGALVEGFLGSLLNLGDVRGFTLQSLALAVGGAVLLLLGYAWLKKNS
jgi:uncharacterized membrane protein YeaQ/YmgE (transglycosylase-associated protein family)